MDIIGSKKEGAAGGPPAGRIRDTMKAQSSRPQALERPLHCKDKRDFEYW